MLTDRTSIGPNGSERNGDMANELVRALESAGFTGERLNQAVAQLREHPIEQFASPSAALRTGGNGNGHSNGHGNGHSRGYVESNAERDLELTENARIILEKRYLQKDANGKSSETPEKLFHRVADAIAEGEETAQAKKLWAGRFYNLMASLKFLPNSPTLVNAGTGGRGCLSACFVVSPEDDMESIMQVAHDAAMIEKWGGGIGFGFSKLRPRKDKIATTHGEACGPIAVMKLYSSVGAALTQGAFRLGAHMGQLRITHPDIREFIHCKDNDDTLQNFNISVQITDEFMRAVEADADWALINPRDTGEGPMNQVVATVKARALWQEICESAWKTGDPGVVFIDRVWETAPNPQMGQIETSNPCVTGDTLVYTGDGLMPIEQLVGQTPALSLDSRSGAESSFAIKVWQSGVKPVYRLVTREGYTLKLTADHKLFTMRGKVPAGELKRGDRIRLLDHKGGFGRFGDRNLGLVLGWLTGDGHIDVKRAVLSFYGEDQALGPVIAEATQAVVAGTGLRPTRNYPTNMHVTSAGRGMVQSERLRVIVRGFGLTEEDWHHVPSVVYQGTEEMQRAYLQALFGADGTVTGNGPEKGVSVRLNSSFPSLLEGVQRLLLNFGIASRIYKRRDERMAFMPDGKGGLKEYKTAANYEVIIGKDNVRRFVQEVGFLSEQKNARLRAAVSAYKEGFYKERFLATFERLEYLGEEPVYDLTEPMTHSFVANGFCISNCGEEFLENYGNCCLGSINLDRHIAGQDPSTGSGRSFDWDELGKTVRTAVRFLNDVIEVNQFPLPKLREVNLATRRIGLGVMGWADALVRMSIPYDSQEAIDLADRLGKFIHDTAWDESAALATERGPFPEYERSRLKEMGMPPVCNASVITIAPTGTISRLAGCSSGIEPNFAIAWWSNVLWKDHEGSNTRLLDAPASVWETLEQRLGSMAQAREVLEKIANDPAQAENILSAYGVDPALFRTSMAISPEAHVRMQAIWQKHVTNSVSKTINLPNSATVDDVANAFWLAWQTNCKAVTVYRDGSKSMQVLETGKKAKPAEEVEEHTHLIVPRQRPTTVRGVTERVRTGHGTMFVTVNFDDEGHPFEVFTTLGKSGGCHGADL
ncbi:MAG: hypothetical protein L0177_12080, partial [Chloroflexi bacterium]|nr:hypothetical protein [Chloroflexota bacterium]